MLRRGGGVALLMVADAGEGGVKNQPKSADVVYGRPHGSKKILRK